MSNARCIMVQGTMSGAGKSLLCAALCRIFAQDGYRVAPFKSQNMALNSFVTRDGLEMGRAQVVQAQAAGIEPDVRMNPILLKPSSDVGSQVIVNGEVRGQMPAAAYFKMKKSLIPDILAAYNSLAEDVDIIVIEGAGSPAEINLKADDIVNMGLARLVDAPVLLAGDIDRGGVFAQLYGTVALLESDERARIKGLIINKFRGDVEILRPGLAMLEEKTHLPVLGVVPYLKVDIEDEDSLSERLDADKAVKPLDLAIVRLPHISNFTDFMPLEQHPLLGVRYVQNARTLGTPDLILLPGTKNTIDDLLWLRQSGLEPALLKLAARGTPVFGVCGGYQMLGETLADPMGSESGRPQTLRGLGLLPTRTVFTAQKRRTQTHATAAAGPFAGAALTGYEIHTGRTEVQGLPFCTQADGHPEGCVQGDVFGTYLHGLFDTGELTEKLVEFLCKRKGIRPESAALIPMEQYRQQQFDRLADGVRSALDLDALYAAMGLNGRSRTDTAASSPRRHRADEPFHHHRRAGNAGPDPAAGNGCGSQAGHPHHGGFRLRPESALHAGCRRRRSRRPAGRDAHRHRHQHGAGRHHAARPCQSGQRGALLHGRPGGRRCRQGRRDHPRCGLHAPGRAGASGCHSGRRQCPHSPSDHRRRDRGRAAACARHRGAGRFCERGGKQRDPLRRLRSPRRPRHRRHGPQGRQQRRRRHLQRAGLLRRRNVGPHCERVEIG